MIRILPNAEQEGEYLLWDGDEVCGKARARFDECVHILSVEAPDTLLEEGMVRAVLNAGRVREIERAVCANETLFPLLRHLEFTPCDEGMTVSIPDFFFRGCKGHNTI